MDYKRHLLVFDTMQQSKFVLFTKVKVNRTVEVLVK